MLKETIQQALDKGLIKSGTIIVDSTHTNASARAKSPTKILRDMSRQLRKEIYINAFELSEKFPEKPSLEAGLDEEIAYTKELLQVLAEGIETNGEMKKAHGLRRADSRGLFAMCLQTYFIVFIAKIKRIVRLKELSME